MTTVMIQNRCCPTITMINISRANVIIGVRQGECNGFHNVKIYANNLQVLDTQEKLSDQIKLDVTMPCVIRINLSGKNLQTDTIVQDGKIIEDKFTEVTSLSIAGLDVGYDVLQNITTYTEKNGNTTQNNFAHSNGDLEIILDCDNPVTWHLKHNSVYAESELRPK